MVVVNRPGYSILRCPECGYVPRCPSCEIALVFHKGARALRCSYCGHEARLFDACPSCGGREVGPAGAGIERIGEELAGIDPSFGVIEETEARLVIGSKRLARGRQAEGFALVAVLGADAFLFVPDFRARERAFQDLCHAAALLRPGGELMLVTRNTADPLFRDIRHFAFDTFAERELAERRDLGYPPFRKLALLSLPGTAKLPRRALPPGVELLGPAPFVDRRGRKGQKYLLKADAPRPLRKALEELRRAAPSLDFDIDPVST
jgi:primosomal protein N' (replication factor Y)